MKKVILFGLLVVFFGGLLVSTALAGAPLSAGGPGGPTTKEKKKKFTLGFSGILTTGRVSTAIGPRTASDAQNYPYSINVAGEEGPFDGSYGFGVVLEYKINPSIRLFLDGNFYTYKRLVAEKEGYGNSGWVYEQSGWKSPYIGPFKKDCYFYMDTTGFRIGTKYVFLPGQIQPWVGIGAGIYHWVATYGTGDRTGKWGSDAGYTGGITYQMGVDFSIGISPKDTILFIIFADFASPVAHPEIDNLFKDGWNWKNVGGNHIMGPYRFGVTLGFSM